MRYEARWIIEEQDGATRAHLRFRTCRYQKAFPSISLIFRNNPIWRVDIQAGDVCHPNPVWAGALGLPPLVCGTHCHTWEDNRDHVARSTVWDLPARRALPEQMRRLPQVLPFMAENLNIELTPDQRSFDTPYKRDLFDLDES
ncbi:hypothetical protein [Hyphococcus sp.]|uniref:hypothetical protein n=1 Tax=Hyphococcus sp. TaxID=2038636 RepID=UPI0035C66B71